MIRKNIFQILLEQKDISTDFSRLDNFFKNRKVVRRDIGKAFSLKEFVELFCFDTWVSNGYCINLDEFLTEVKYPHAILTDFCNPEDSVRDFLVAIETIYNLWYVAKSFLSIEAEEGRFWNVLPAFEMLKEMMDSQLESMNYKSIYNADKAQVIVVENDPAITAVVEVVDPHLVAPILQYNHHLLHGQLDEKKKILLTLGSDLEARRANLKKTESTTLESDIFFILNSFDIRHNNREGSKKKDYIVNMSLSDLEYWYDNLFQMFLLAYLELDNLPRKKLVADFKQQIGEAK